MARQTTWTNTKKNCEKYNLPYVADGDKAFSYDLKVDVLDKSGKSLKRYVCMCVAKTSKEAIDSVKKDFTESLCKERGECSVNVTVTGRERV